MAIHLGSLLPGASSNQPGRRCGNAFRAHAAEATRTPCRPYSVLLPVGFTVTAPVTRRAVRSYRTVSPLPFLSGLPRSARLEAASLKHVAENRERRFVFCGTFPGVAPAGRYPAPCFRGARTFLHPAYAFEPRPTAHTPGSGHPAN